MTLAVEMLNPNDLKPYYLNAKPHRIKLGVLKASIKRFGFDQPVVVDEDGVILKGHGRRIAAIELFLPEVPVIRKTGLTADQKKLIRVEDNRVFEISEIDEGTMKEQLSDMQLDGVDGLEKFFSGEMLDLGVTTTMADLKMPAPAAGVAPEGIEPVPMTTAPTTEKPKFTLVNCPKCGQVFEEPKVL